ncbi:MAG: polysaccharide pyruvyl transferase family protein [Ruminococcaceae bacterium]|nr:polysaccharide pyruvyl transferase family protein [Oscillospiraceae bacterium]
MKNVLIVCQCATNKGDRAVAEFLISQLKKENEIKITLSTTRPDLWENLKQDGIEVIGTGYKSLSFGKEGSFISKVIKRLTRIFYNKVVFKELIDKKKKPICNLISKDFINRVKRADTVIITGGHHITSIREKNALFSITYDIGLVAEYSKRYVLWSQTIGPLEFSSDIYKNYFVNLIDDADLCFIRDKNSAECIKSIGCNGKNIRTTYDSVFGFGLNYFGDYEKRQNKVGISIFNGLKKAYDTFPEIAGILDWFASKGYSIEFFRMEYEGGEQNDIEKIVSLMKEKAEISVFDFKTNTQKHLEELATCKYYIGYKTHSVIMALTTATPLLGICYHKKTRDFMEEFGVCDFSVDDTVLTKENGIEIAEKLCLAASDLNMKMKKIAKSIAEKIDSDFEEVLYDRK